MRILELLLPKGVSDRSLSSREKQHIDNLQTRMDLYVDKILDPHTGISAKDFLKSKLRNDYNELKELIPEGWRKSTTYDKKGETVPKNPAGGFLTCDKCKKTFSKNGITRHRCIPKKDNISEVVQKSAEWYEVYDHRTGKTVPNRGPYSSRRRAMRAVDKLDNEYGGYRYGYRLVKQSIKEAVHRLPLTDKDFELVKRLMEKPIPAIVAPIYLSEIIDDDELNDQFRELEELEPGRDIRPLVSEWFNRVMPDQMYRFTDEVAGDNQRKGILSPIHGYDAKMYRGTNDPVTGDAYGRR